MDLLTAELLAQKVLKGEATLADMIEVSSALLWALERLKERPEEVELDSLHHALDEAHERIAKAERILEMYGALSHNAALRALRGDLE